MSAPSDLHESRVRLLRDLADLSGYTLDVAAYTNLRPDVCRLHRGASSIMIADAMATESSVGGATRRRLVRYATAARLWANAGLQVAFGTCHDHDAERAWIEALVCCLEIAGHSPSRTTYSVLDNRSAISIVVVDAPSSRQTQCSGSSAIPSGDPVLVRALL